MANEGVTKKTGFKTGMKLLGKGCKLQSDEFLQTIKSMVTLYLCIIKCAYKLGFLPFCNPHSHSAII